MQKPKPTRSAGSRNVASSAAVAPKPSASVIVINAANEILLVQRNPTSQSFANAHVFPGGNQDATQDDSLETTAIRELFEETGLLLASGSSGCTLSDAELDQAREEVHAQRRLFRDFLADRSLTADIKSLLPFTRWVTPPTMPSRRFQTNFYVTFLESAPSAGFSAGGKQERLPTPDGGQEVVSARFIHPASALEECRTNAIALMPPQVYLMSALADFLKGNENTQTQRDRVRGLSEGTFGQLLFQPLALPERDDQGRTILTYDGDEARGGPKGRLHRCVCKFGKGGIATDVVIQRNFDIYAEGISGERSKL
ncbi:hypothetical protein WOLCODRAFT_65842 [Wolfiporia cocos MD-104 SS10]|uniref:Nudix hydrolase domain-containing protein n=1 Tax=Wolfiporia cocos (strain MD-104) TaxID=742152 RepID=A0A2H3JNX6_WOLCO|nr:hypothetical protein WOLCODRAFT_65842 [Wolfiporia cocos MD-104 SS10]